MKLLHGLTVIGLLLFLVSACSSESDDTATTDSGTTTRDLGGVDRSGNTQTDTGTPDLGQRDTGITTDTGVATSVSVSGTVLSLLREEPIDMVEVCIYERPEIACVTTNVDGFYTLHRVPANSEVALSYNGSGLAPFLVMLRTEGEDLEDIGHFQANEVELQLITTVTNVDIDDNKGSLFFALYREWPPGDGEYLSEVTVEHSPASGSGVIYGDESGTPDLDMTSTSGAGNGGFMNVDVGFSELIFSHPSRQCFPAPTRWRGSVDSAMRMQSAPGYLSYATAYCPQ